jgi:hypothetical protein
MTRSSSRPKNAASPQDGDQHGLRSPGDAWPRGATQASEPESTMRPADAADYIAQMTVELARIARTARLEPLAYFLEMARIEATTSLRRIQNRR